MFTTTSRTIQLTHTQLNIFDVRLTKETVRYKIKIKLKFRELKMCFLLYSTFK
jgi:hypothetical protein